MERLDIAVRANKPSCVLSELASAFYSPYLLHFVVLCDHKLIMEVDSRTSVAWEEFHLVAYPKPTCIACEQQFPVFFRKTFGKDSFSGRYDIRHTKIGAHRL